VAAGAADRNGDRTLAALALMDQAAAAGGAPFVEAAIEDAARAARGAGLVTAAAPFHRPRGLGLAAALGAVVGIGSLWPVPRAPAAPTVVRPPTTARKGPKLEPGALAAERAAAERAAQQAAALEDAELARLAAELSRILDSLAEGQLGEGEALDQLARLEREAAQAAEAGQSAVELMRAAADALDREKQTRALAEAMREHDGPAGKKAAEELAAGSKELSGGQRERLAQSLAKAAAAGAQAASGQGGEGQRRLDSGEKRGGEGGEAASQAERDRRLKQLERDLSDSAERCRKDPEACRRALEQMGADLPQAARDARQSRSRDQLGRSTQQLRERLRRQSPSSGGEQAAEESFERAAGGVRPMPLEGGQQGPAQGREGAQASAGGSAAAPGAQASAAAGGGESEQRAAGGESGDGVGSGPGSEPLGSRERGGGARGQQHEVKVRDGEGPSRAEVIEAGAHRGFARTEYQRVFQDYSAVVEETLDTTAVPAARRYLVRRYFQLIRPRDAREAPSARNPGGVRGR
jgi:hypothetical protein